MQTLTRDKQPVQEPQADALPPPRRKRQATRDRGQPAQRAQKQQEQQAPQQAQLPAQEKAAPPNVATQFPTRFDTHGSAEFVLKDIQQHVPVIFGKEGEKSLAHLEELINQYKANNKVVVVSLTRGYAQQELASILDRDFDHDGQIVIDPDIATPDHQTYESVNEARIKKGRLSGAGGSNGIMLVMYGLHTDDIPRQYNIAVTQLRRMDGMVVYMMESDDPRTETQKIMQMDEDLKRRLQLMHRSLQEAQERIAGLSSDDFQRSPQTGPAVIPSLVGMISTTTALGVAGVAAEALARQNLQDPNPQQREEFLAKEAREQDAGFARERQAHLYREARQDNLESNHEAEMTRLLGLEANAKTPEERQLYATQIRAADQQFRSKENAAQSLETGERKMIDRENQVRVEEDAAAISGTAEGQYAALGHAEAQRGEASFNREEKREYALQGHRESERDARQERQNEDAEAFEEKKKVTEARAATPPAEKPATEARRDLENIAAAGTAFREEFAEKRKETGERANIEKEMADARESTKDNPLAHENRRTQADGIENRQDPIRDTEPRRQERTVEAPRENNKNEPPAQQNQPSAGGNDTTQNRQGNARVAENLRQENAAAATRDREAAAANTIERNRTREAASEADRTNSSVTLPADRTDQMRSGTGTDAEYHRMATTAEQHRQDKRAAQGTPDERVATAGQNQQQHAVEAGQTQVNRSQDAADVQETRVARAANTQSHQAAQARDTQNHRMEEERQTTQHRLEDERHAEAARTEQPEQRPEADKPQRPEPENRQPDDSRTRQTEEDNRQRAARQENETRRQVSEDVNKQHAQAEDVSEERHEARVNANNQDIAEANRNNIQQAQSTITENFQEVTQPEAPVVSGEVNTPQREVDQPRNNQLAQQQSREQVANLNPQTVPETPEEPPPTPEPKA